jgi:phosphomannomutase
VTLRPSGTEPKLKAYVEVVTDPGDDLAAARTRATAHLEGLKEAVRGLFP